MEFRRESMSRISVYEGKVQVGYIKDSCCYTLIKVNAIRNAIRVDYHAGQGGLLANSYKAKLQTEHKSLNDKSNYQQFLVEYEKKVMDGEIIGEYDLVLKSLFTNMYTNKAYSKLCENASVIIGVSHIHTGAYRTIIETKPLRLVIDNLETKKIEQVFTTIENYEKDIVKYSDETKYRIR